MFLHLRRSLLLLVTTTIAGHVVASSSSSTTETYDLTCDGAVSGVVAPISHDDVDSRIRTFLAAAAANDDGDHNNDQDPWCASISSRSWTCRAGRRVADAVDAETTLNLRDDGDGAVTVRLEVTATGPGARDALIAKALPSLGEVFDDVEDVVWTITPRPRHASGNDNDPASLDRALLGDASLLRKRLLETRGDAALWEHVDPVAKRAVRSMFVRDVLRYDDSRRGAARAEALVHPALLSHPNPALVVLESDFPLPIIKEVLKHKKVGALGVFSVKLSALELAVEHAPELNDCSDMREDYGPHDATFRCLDHPKLEHVDAREFLDFLWNDRSDWTERQFELWEGGNVDVILLDVIPWDYEASYGLEYHEWLQEETRDGTFDSVVVLHGGRAPPDLRDDDDGTVDENDHRTQFLRMASRETEHGGLGLGWSTFHVYEEPNAYPMYTSYVLITGEPVNSKTYRRFVRSNVAAIDLDIARTMYRSSASYVPTRHYDGATHVSSYLRPPRVWEDWYCRKEPWRSMAGCTHFLPRIMDTRYHLEKTSIEVHPVKGRNTYAPRDIPEGHLVLPDDAWQSIFFEAEQYEALFQFVEEVPSAVLYKQMLDVIDGYGFQVSSEGFTGFVCSTTNNTFTNHACDEKQLNVNPMVEYFTDEDGIYGNHYFCPIMSRRKEITGVSTWAMRDIKKGEEILMDYRHLRDSGQVRESEASMCEDGGIIPVHQASTAEDGAAESTEEEEKEDDDDDDDGDVFEDDDEEPERELHGGEF